MENQSNLERIYNGLLKENPIFVLAIGMCPTFAITTSAINGIGMGLATTVVLALSNLLISLIRKIIPDSVRVPIFLVIVASFVTIVQFLMEGFLPSLYDALGIYIPLIVVNCIILGRAEAYAYRNPPLLSLFDGIGMGLGFTFAVTWIGAVRELIGSGKIFGYQLLPLADLATGKAGYEPVAIFVMAPGAFLALSVLVAIMNTKRKKKGMAPLPIGCSPESCAACGNRSCVTRNSGSVKVENTAKAAQGGKSE